MGKVGSRVMRWGSILAPAIILCALVIATWWPALFEGKTLIHGDAVSVGIVSAKAHADALAGLRSLSWAADIYGGHPYFAESIGGFSNPLNIIFAALVSPHFGFIAAANWLHCLYMILACTGFVCLARSIGLGPWAQILAGIAAVFSSAWVQLQPNSTLAAVLAALPWALCAFELWLKQPTYTRAIAFGAACAWMLLSGYPQIVYGAILYMGASLLPGFLQSSVRQEWLATWRARVSTGAIAIAFCLGAAAVQLAPLLELAGESFRRSGAALIMPPTWDNQVRGALFWPSWTLDSAQFPIVGSLLVCALASLAPILNRTSRVIGHFASVCLLTMLGLGPAFPLFTWIYDHNLIPGLHAFRVMHPFHLVGVVGIGLLAGIGADALARIPRGDTLASLRAASTRPALWLSIIIVALWITLAAVYDLSDLPRLTLWLAIGGGVAILILIALRQAVWIAPVLAGLLCVDAVVQRIHSYPFYENAVLSEPREAALIQSMPEWREYRHAHVTWAEIYGFKQHTDPRLLPEFQRVTHGIVASTNVLWGIPSMNGSLALMLARRRMLDGALRSEWLGEDPTPAGLRISDVLSIRFLSFDNLVEAPAYRLLEHNEALNLFLMENTAARPRFQFYARHVEVHSPEAALEILSDLREPLLVVETPPDGAPHQQVAALSAQNATYQLLEDRPDRYRLRVTAPGPVWLFLADADYPGWRATIDGAATPVYAAQILGKAVLAPAGTHDVVLEFRSSSLIWGGWITGATLLLAAGGLLWVWRRTRSSAGALPPAP